MANVAQNIGTMHLYPASEHRKGFKGFIDAQGIADLLWIEENLGGKMYIAAGMCPQCGNKQITIYMGFAHTNCLNCRYQMSLAPANVPKPPLEVDQETIDVDYEDVTETLTEAQKVEQRLKLVPFRVNRKVKWPKFKPKKWRIPRKTKKLLKKIHL